MKFPGLPKFLLSEKSRIIAVAVLMIVALTVVSLWNRNAPVAKKPNALVLDQQQAAIEAQADPVASESIMKNIVDPGDIASQLADTFDVKQDISLVGIPDSKLIAAEDSAQNVGTYIDNLNKLLSDYNTKISAASAATYDGTNGAVFDKAYADTKDTLAQLYKMPVPRDAFDMHKDVLNVLMANSDLFVKDKLSPADNEDLWKFIYKDYAVMELAAGDMKSELDRLTLKYNLK